jgi:hypothetical protein
MKSISEDLCLFLWYNSSFMVAGKVSLNWKRYFKESREILESQCEWSKGNKELRFWNHLIIFYIDALANFGGRWICFECARNSQDLTCTSSTCLRVSTCSGRWNQRLFSLRSAYGECDERRRDVSVLECAASYVKWCLEKNDCYPRFVVDVELMDCVEITCESWSVTRWCHMELSQLAY